MVRLVRAFLVVALVFSSGLMLGAATTLSAWGQGRSPYQALDVLARVLVHVERDYVEPVDAEVLVQHAIQGMVDALDPHSVYLDPQTWKRMQSGDASPVELLGLELAAPGEGEAGHRVTRVVPTSPAEKAGIQVDDRLVGVDGADVRTWPAGDVAALLVGPAGEPVRLDLERGGAAFRTVAVRETVVAPAVEPALFAPGWGYVRIVHFRHRVHAELKRALQALEAQGGQPLRGLVLDVRDNPGGVLSEAVAVCDLFLRGGRIVATEGRKAGETDAWEAHASSDDLDLPLVILMNGGSASASEIVAGALRDRGRARLVGGRSFGKGSVQSVYTFEDGSALKLTVSRYTLPSGEVIPSGRGLVPDVEIPLEDPASAEARLRAALQAAHLEAAERDQLLADLDALAAGSRPRATAEVPWTGTLDERLARDRQLATAWRELRGAVAN